MTMVQVPEGKVVSTGVNIMVNRKKVMLDKDAPLTSHLADYIGQFLLDPASLKTVLA